MTRHERVRYEMLLRVRDFGSAHPNLFPESLPGHRALAAVERAIEAIEAHAMGRLIAVREGPRTKAAWRAILLDRMRPIARTSKGVSTVDGGALALPMPARQADTKVLTAALAFLSQAEMYQDQFVNLGLSPTCLTELREAADAFAAALAGRRAGRSSIAAAQASVIAALASGAAAVRTLDIVVVNMVGHDPALLAAWRRSRIIVEGKGRGRARGGRDAASSAGTTTGEPQTEREDGPPAGGEETSAQDALAGV